VTLTQRTSPSGSTVHGLCTKFLSSLSLGETCRVFVRESLFKLPPSLRTPVIMIGPGSGIAPMRALLQEREFRAKADNLPLQEVTNVLFFGCKSRKLDFLYEEELIAALDRHALTSLRLAFSRESEEKVYVQHLMRQPEPAEEIARLLDAGAHIFVCGGTEMGAAVAESFASILASHKGESSLLSLFSLSLSPSFPLTLSLSPCLILSHSHSLSGVSLEEAQAMVKEAQRVKSYKQELWSV
jgi:NADPH-ferrihemoprotein reductase